MAADVARDFALCDRGLVVAPAGHGKTCLIAEAVGYAPGRQLVLTHTHAGVGALCGKLNGFGVPHAKYRVTTIDSFALRYANAFPHLAGWFLDYPSSNEEWTGLRVAASRLFRCRAPRRVLQASYAGVFVDEYQDCCGTQHEMIGVIAEALPCRVVGDPLQAVYRRLHPSDVAKWSTVEGLFPAVGSLTEPHRWRRSNPLLGEWLAEVRSRLVTSTEVDFGDASGIINWIQSADTKFQIAACYRAFQKDGVVAICDWPGRCAAIAGRTKNHFTVLESVECPDLLQAAKDIEDSRGASRVACVVDLAQKCFTGMSSLTRLVDRMKKGKAYSPRSPGNQPVWLAMQGVVESSDLRAVENLMSAIDSVSFPHFQKRRELWREMKRAIQICDPPSGRSLREVAWSLRDNGRRNGRRILPKRTVATPLLIKGLEFDHALLLDAKQMGSAEELYVALTRGASSLTVLSSERKVKHSAPAWIRERTA
jgi:UvrD-like helicase family protein